MNVNDLTIRFPKPRPELLLHPNIPKSLHGVNPRTIKGRAWWDIERRKAYAKMGGVCWACGSSGRLEAHEVYNIDYTIGKVKLVEICALCHDCHSFIHNGRSQALVAKGQMTKDELNRITDKGFSILGMYDIDYYVDTPDVVAPWGDWHLELDGKCYYSKFKSIEEWAAHYEVEL